MILASKGACNGPTTITAPPLRPSPIASELAAGLTAYFATAGRPQHRPFAAPA